MIFFESILSKNMKYWDDFLGSAKQYGPHWPDWFPAPNDPGPLNYPEDG